MLLLFMDHEIFAWQIDTHRLATFRVLKNLWELIGGVIRRLRRLGQFCNFGGLQVVYFSGQYDRNILWRVCQSGYFMLFHEYLGSLLGAIYRIQFGHVESPGNVSSFKQLLKARL